MNVGEVRIPPGKELVIQLADEFVGVPAVEEGIEIIRGPISGYSFIRQRELAGNVQADGVEIRRHDLIAGKRLTA